MGKFLQGEKALSNLQYIMSQSRQVFTPTISGKMYCLLIHVLKGLGPWLLPLSYPPNVADSLSL